MAEQTRATRVTLVDDDALVLAVVSDGLEAAHYQVKTFRTAEEALADLWDGGTDLLVTDLLLPHMSGLDLIRELRSRPWAERLPIITLSALRWDAEQLGSLVRSLERWRMLAKPVQMSALRAAAAELLAETTLTEVQPAIRWPSRTLPLVRPSTSELRAAGKERVQLSVSLATPRELMSEYTQSLMHDGLFVHSYHPLEVDTEVEVQLTLSFRPMLKLTGRVVQTIELESPEGVTRGPGMAIALYDLGKDVKREMAAFVAGLRAASAGLIPRPGRHVVLVGLRPLLPGESATFLRRSEVRPLHAVDLPGMMELARRVQPALVAIHAGLLTDDPRPWLAALHAAGVRRVVVVADAEQAARLPQDLPFVRVVPPEPDLASALALTLTLATRAAARVPLEVRVEVSRTDGAILAQLENLSLGGMMLTTESPCAVGERLQVAFELPDEKGGIRGAVRTLRVGRKASSSALQVAASFERLEVDAIEALRRFLEARVGPDAYRFMVTH